MVSEVCPPNGGSSIRDGDEAGCMLRRPIPFTFGCSWELSAEAAARAGAHAASCDVFGFGKETDSGHEIDVCAWRLTFGHAGASSGNISFLGNTNQASRWERVEVVARRLTIGHAGAMEIISAGSSGCRIPFFLPVFMWSGEAGGQCKP